MTFPNIHFQGAMDVIQSYDYLRNSSIDNIKEQLTYENLSAFMNSMDCCEEYSDYKHDDIQKLSNFQEYIRKEINYMTDFLYHYKYMFDFEPEIYDDHVLIKLKFKSGEFKEIKGYGVDDDIQYNVSKVSVSVDYKNQPDTYDCLFVVSLTNDDDKVLYIPDTCFLKDSHVNVFSYEFNTFIDDIFLDPNKQQLD